MYPKLGADLESKSILTLDYKANGTYWNLKLHMYPRLGADLEL